MMRSVLNFLFISLFIRFSLSAQEPYPLSDSTGKSADIAYIASEPQAPVGKPFSADSLFRSGNIEFLIPTFRGNTERNFYGIGEVNRLDVLWKFYLGEGRTVISRKLGERRWKGAGWTGQVLLVKEGRDTFLIQGAYDHHLRKINAANGKEVWKYKFDDVIKGTGTLWANHQATRKENSILIMQGSRLGTDNWLDSEFIPSYRAISYFTGKELWRMDVKFTKSYSRDVDASSLVYSDTAYIGLENGVFLVFDAAPDRATFIDSMLQPRIYEEHLLYNEADYQIHKGNLVTESSPALLNGHIYVASGSGHVYGYDLKKRKIDWDFYTGTDMDGSVVVTRDSCILVSVEKQYVEGRGGVFKLDPSKHPDSCVCWYFPVKDTTFAGWQGGVIGTVAVNDGYVGETDAVLAAVSALDGYTYILRHDSIDPGKKAPGPSQINLYPQPVLVDSLVSGPSIASPVFTENRLLVASYQGLFLYSYDKARNFCLLDRFAAAIEASPLIWGRKVFVATREGYLYCLGEKQP